MTADTYIQHLRSDRKREYAVAYWKFLCDGSPDGQEPERGELSYLAAQAVRLALTDCLFETERSKTL